MAVTPVRMVRDSVSLIDGVEQLVELHALVLAQVLADAVGHHHGIVDGVAEDGQQRRHDRQVELELEQREDAGHQQHVVQQRYHHADRELPFEAEPHVGTDGQQADEHGDDAGHPAARSTRPVPPPRRAAARSWLPSASTTFCSAACCAPSPPGCCSTRISTSVGAPNCWICTAPRPSLPSLSRSWRDVGRAGGRLHLDHGAALEVDAVVEAHGEEQQPATAPCRRSKRRAPAPL